MVPSTSPWLDNVLFWSSRHVKKFGSQPMNTVAPSWTTRLPSTVKLELPVPVESFNPKIDPRADPGLTVRLPLISAGPALTKHSPFTTTLEVYVPLSTQGAASVPLHTVASELWAGTSALAGEAKAAIDIAITAATETKRSALVMSSP